jgi:ectoine hydroxylase-related dioxygenase (phytanoyl-CoA dioxygenase family)
VLYSSHVNAINLGFGITSFKEFINMSADIKARLEGFKEKYERDGYVVVKNVLDANLIEEVRSHIDWLLEKNPGTRPEQLHHTLMVDESKAVDIVLEPGDVSIHHPQIIHGSNPNHSDDWRRALTIRYIPTTTRVTEKTWPTVFHLRGKTVPGVNFYRPYPHYVKEKHMPFRGCENWPPAKTV